jgi:hypothetical protein
MPLAAADATNPDCEANQPGTGSGRTAPAWTLVQDDLGLPVNSCEGEHWDGQDPVSDQPGPCTGNVNADPSDFAAAVCTGPNGPTGNAADDPLNPLGVRVTSDGDQVYVGTNILLVGKAVVYADSDTVAVYIHDNTPTNVLASVVSAPRITQGHVSEADCDQATYQAGAENGDARCGRDNTAITVEILA